MANIEDLKREFLEYLEIERGRSLKTIANYDRYLDRFFIQTKVSKPKEITDDVVREFRIWLNRQKSDTGDMLKKRTQNYHLIALRALLKYFDRRNIESLPPERIELAKTPVREPDFISIEELNRLTEAPKGEDLKNLRDAAILELLFSTGLRVSELCSLPRNIDLSKDEFSVRGKCEKVRTVFLSPEAKNILHKYLAKRVDFDGALFIRIAKAQSNDSLRLTSRSIERIVKHYAIKAGISKKVTPHIIRHSFAADLLQNGADVRSVQALLGHANITTTQVYAHATDLQLHEIYKNFHGKRRK